MGDEKARTAPRRSCEQPPPDPANSSLFPLPRAANPAKAGTQKNKQERPRVARRHTGGEVITRPLVIARSVSDEAIQLRDGWIASLRSQ